MERTRVEQSEHHNAARREDKIPIHTLVLFMPIDRHNLPKKTNDPIFNASFFRTHKKEGQGRAAGV